MADDFLAELSAAADNGGKFPSNEAVDNVVNNGEDTNTPSSTPQDTKVNENLSDNPADHLDRLFGDGPSEHIAGTEPKSGSKEEKPETKAQDGEDNRQEEDNSQQNQQKPQRKSRAQTTLLDTFLKEDKEGNLVNDKGEIIASAGTSRDYYERLKAAGRAYRDNAQNLAQSNIVLGEKFKELYDAYNALSEKASFDITKETGFTDAETKQAIQIMKAYKQDPIAAIKSLLTQAQANGIDVSQIGANITANPADMRTLIQDIINERIGPIAQQTEEQTAVQKAQEMVRNFFAKFPEAEQYENAIAEAKQRFPQMSLNEIWLRLSRELNKKQEIPQNKTQYQRETKRPAVPSRQRVVKKAQTPPKISANMSIDDIAKSIKEDFS